MGDDEDQGPKFNKASADDEFLRHSYSGAHIRNPLLNKNKSTPILFQACEFDHNCLDDALADYHCISITEKSLREMTASASTGEMIQKPVTPDLKRGPLARAALGRLNELPTGYEFIVTLRKSTYVPPRQNRRRPIEARKPTGQLIDKVNIEVTDTGKLLRVETVNEGLVMVWNKNNRAFNIKEGDLLVKVNEVKASGAAMIEELLQEPDKIRITVRRSNERTGSKAMGELVLPA